MDSKGDITRKGWDQINEDMDRVEANTLAWLRFTFVAVRDEGHDSYGDLVGMLWFDPNNYEQARLVELASQDGGRGERIDMVDVSYGDLGNTAFNGISDFGASVLGGQVTFYDVKPEDMEALVVGDAEAKEVGFPFWTRVAYFDAADLDPTRDEVRSALDSIDVDDYALEDLEPEQRALTIASALLDYGRADEGPAGWSGDIGIPAHVKWSNGEVGGPEYLADEDEAFVREVLLDDLDVDYESYGPDDENPTSGLKVQTRGFTVEITEWTDVEDATGDEQPEGEKIVRQYAEVELDELFDPKGKHRGAYSGDDRSIGILELAKMDEDDREKAIVAAAIAYMAYYGGEEEFVDQIGD